MEARCIIIGTWFWESKYLTENKYLSLNGCYKVLPGICQATTYGTTNHMIDHFLKACRTQVNSIIVIDQQKR